MPKVSVIIPVYNVAPYLKKSMDSVVNQTLRDIEIICVDDCSTDNSLEILKEYASKDDRIKLIALEKNQGPGVARNKALKVATGEYISFVDPDDWADTKMLDTLYHQALKFNSDVVLFEIYKYFEESDTLKEPVLYKKAVSTISREKAILEDKAILTFEMQKLITLVSSQYSYARLYKNSFIQKNNIMFSNHKCYEDLMFGLKTFLFAKNISYNNERLYYYRIRPTSILRSSKNKINCFVAVVEDIYNYLKENSFYYDYETNFKVSVLYDALNKSFTKNSVFAKIYIYLKLKKYFNKKEKSFLIKKLFEPLYTNIFSVKNIKQGKTKRKVITIFGLQIKFKIKHEWLIQKCNNNYKKVIVRLKRKIKNNEKLKVGFMVSENQKWHYQSLYDIFENSKFFEPYVFLTVLKNEHLSKKFLQSNINVNAKFFQDRNIKIDYLYKDNRYLDISKFGIDIIFYEQPWRLPEEYRPISVSDKMLTCYTPYSFSPVNFESDFIPNFHGYLWKNYSISNLIFNENALKEMNKSSNSFFIGYSKLDVYFDSLNVECNIWKEPQKYRIIYAPHHSFDNSLNMATFLENGKLILELAKNSKDTTWIFKPHPRLKYALLKNGIMTDEEVEAYRNEWEKIGAVYTSGDYFDIFKSSNMMITDCCSFLAEYLPTGKPIIRPIHKGSLELNNLGSKIVQGYYDVRNMQELEKVFDDLVYKKIDKKVELRKQLTPLVIDYKERSADKIYNDLLKELHIRK